MNRSPTDASGTARRSAIRTSIMEGGIRIPRVPVAHAVPTAKPLSYLFSIITGRDNMPRSTTDAPMIPVVAANRTPITMTVTA